MDTQEILQLAERRGFPKVSLYIPTHVAGPEIRQDPIHLKNAITSAREKIKEEGMNGGNLDDFFAEATSKLGLEEFWWHQSKSLAVFIEEGETLWYQLPVSVEELTIVADRYHLRPLLQIYGNNAGFHVLAVSRGGVAFYDADRRGMQKRDVQNCPESFDEFRATVDFEDNVDFHSNARGGETGGALGTPQFHVQGRSPEDYDEVLLEQYVRQIANAVDKHLADANAPLVLVGEPRTLGRFKSFSHYKHAMESVVDSSPEAMDEAALYKNAREIAAPHLSGERDAALKRLAANLNSSDGLGSEDLSEVTRAAVEGRMDTLFLVPDAHVWGHYDRASHDIVVEEEPGATSTDLLDFLAIETMRNGGQVFAFPAKNLPTGSPAAGLFRY